MTSLPPDPYKTLGVSKDAQIAEIRSAHRKLILKCHPDKVQDPALKAQKQDEFQKVQHAYEILSDEKERLRYDDQARLAELRRQMQAKANSSAPRATPTYKEPRTSESRPSSYKSTSGTPPSARGFAAFSKSWEHDISSSARGMYDEGRTVRRESSYTDKPRRESERERERERERDRERERERGEREQREKEKDRERRKKEKEREAKEAEKAKDKEARRQEKKRLEKEQSRARKRETEEKRRAPYIEEDEIVTKEKKKSSRKHDEKRDRSSHREEIPTVVPPPVPTMPYNSTLEYAASYIQASKAKKNAYAAPFAPPAPTPPLPQGQSSAFAVPAAVDDDARRSSATKARRGSSGEKAYKKKASQEVLDDSDAVEASPSARNAQKSATNAAMSGSPPRREFTRQATMPTPMEPYERPVPHMSRAQTYHAGSYDASYQDMSPDPRGRSRSKLQPQVPDSESEDEQERRHRKHRSKKHRSPEGRTSEHVKQYKVVEGGRTKLQGEYMRSYDSAEAYASYYPSGHGHDVRSIPIRESSYSKSPGAYASFPKVKTSKMYDYEDINYSAHYPHYDDSYAARA